MSINPEIITRLARARMFEEGHYVYRSGLHAAVKFNRDRLLADPDSASAMGYALAKSFFTNKIDTVACPSIWGAGLAQWVAWFLEPRANVVIATATAEGSLAISPDLRDLIAGKRVLLIDNLVFSGQTMMELADLVTSTGGELIGAGCLWSEDPNHPDTGVPFVGLLNTVFPVWDPDACPLCDQQGSEAEPVGW